MVPSYSFRRIDANIGVVTEDFPAIKMSSTILQVIEGVLFSKCLTKRCGTSGTRRNPIESRCSSDQDCLFPFAVMSPYAAVSKRQELDPRYELSRGGKSKTSGEVLDVCKKAVFTSNFYIFHPNRDSSDSGILIPTGNHLAQS